MLRSELYDSTLGGYGWLASVCLLLVAFLGHRSTPLRFLPGQTQPEPHTMRISRRAEFAIVAGIFLLALVLRFYRLDDWTMGMHGDEGEAGTDALEILNGTPASPFGTGWFAQPNFYYYALVYSMRIFGTGLFGLRFFSALMGALVLLPVYGLTRLWFGVRLAAIAAFLLAISDVALAFSRMQFSNITNPFFVAASLFFLYLGFKSGRAVFYILSAYSAMLTVYFYMGGRLAPFITAGVIGYVLVFLPATCLASAYSRSRGTGQGIASRMRRALVYAFSGLRASLLNLVLFVVASYCFAAPFLYYYLDHSDEMDARTQEKLVLNNADRMRDQYGLNHDPLYLGLRLPSLDGPYPGLPLTFEESPLSIQVAADGFWPRVFWNQLTTSLSMITYRADVSGVFTFSGDPITKPVEAALVVLGIAWAAWRWRDARMGALNVWFWSTILVGGVLTIDAPYVARLVGIIPCLAIFAALIVDKTVVEALRLARLAMRNRARFRRVALGLSTGTVLCLLAFLAGENIRDYFVRYASTYPFTITTGMAVFVRDTNESALSAGRPLPHYYNLGGPVIIWNYGVNRFLNYGTEGEDVVNASDALPIIDNTGRDSVFMVWPGEEQYLDILKSYYPGGRIVPFHYSEDGKGDPLLISYQVSAQELASHRVTSAAYIPLQGRRIDRQEPGFGTGSPPPEGLAYPAQAIWSGGLIAPQFARYRFDLSAPNGASLLIDDRQVLKVDAGNASVGTEVILARGPHRVQLSGRLNASSDIVRLEWSAGASVSAPIAPNYLWNGPAGGLEADVSIVMSDPSTGAPDGGSSAPVVMRRVDGIIGFQASDQSFQTGRATSVTWQGTLDAPVDGKYGFELSSDGGSILTLDGHLVVDNQIPKEGSTNGQGDIELTRGRHNVVLRYNWSDGPSVIELYWTPPGGAKSLVGPETFGPAEGLWLPGTILEPQPYQLPPPSEGEAGGPVLKLEKTLGKPGDLLLPRGIAVDTEGRVFVGDRGHHRIVVYGADGSLLMTWGSAPANPAQPGPGEFVDIADLALGSGGTLYVLDRGNPLIQAFDSQGRYLRAVDTRDLKAYNPNGIDAVGQQLYIADTGKNRLLKLNDLQSSPSSVSFGDQPGSQPLDQPVDVAVLSAPAGTNAAEEKLFAVTQDSALTEYSGAGAFVNRWSIQTGGNDGGSRITAWEGSKLLISDPDRGRLTLFDPAVGTGRYFGEGGSEENQLGVITGIAEGPASRLYVLNSDRDYVQVFTLENKK